MAGRVESMKNLIWFVLFLVGCSESATELTAWQKAMRDGSVETVAATKAVESKTDEAIGILKDNTTALAAIKAKVDALQVVSNPNGKDGDPESAPESPAKANDTPNPLKVATPGTSSESLTELATRLYGQGVSVHMKTEEQLRAIDAQLNGGAPVGAIFQNNRTSAVTSQRSAVRLVPRGKGVVRWQRNSAGQTCGPNGCY
jgi:hypothetical protein